MGRRYYTDRFGERIDLATGETVGPVGGPKKVYRVGISITMPDYVSERLNKYATRVGLNRSKAGAQLIEAALQAQEQVQELIDKTEGGTEENP